MSTGCYQCYVIILPYSDQDRHTASRACRNPDRYQFQPNVKIKLYFFKKFEYAVENTENYYTYNTDEK